MKLGQFCHVIIRGGFVRGYVSEIYDNGFVVKREDGHREYFRNKEDGGIRFFYIGGEVVMAKKGIFGYKYKPSLT